jgi:hypothetical protein
METEEKGEVDEVKEDQDDAEKRENPHGTK